MASWREWGWMAALGLLVSLLAALGPGREQAGPAGTQPWTTYSMGEQGLGGIYRLLESESPPPLRWRRPLAELTDGVQRVVVWAPAGLEAAEWAALGHWAGGGRGRLAVVASPPALAGARPQPAAAPAAAGGASTARVTRLEPWNAGVQQIALGPGLPSAAGWPAAAATYLADAAGRPVAVGWAEGSGRVVFFTAPEWLANGWIARDDNLRLALNLLTGPGRTAFAEWHHGFRDPAWAGGGHPLAPWWPAAAQAALAVLLVLAWRAGRFGSPVPLPPQPPRYTAESAVAMGNLYRQARQRGAVTAALQHSLLAGLRRLGAPAGAGPEALGRLYAARTGRPAAELTALLADLEHGADVITLSRRTETVQRRLEHGASHSGSRP